MKKKLFLLITCFFLFSSLTIFLIHRNMHPVGKDKTDKNITNDKDNPDKEKKPKEKDNENENNQKETDDLPWTYTWKGAIASLMLTLLIDVIIAAFIILQKKAQEKAREEDPEVKEFYKKEKEKKEKNIKEIPVDEFGDEFIETNAKKKKTVNILLFTGISTFLYLVIFPLIFAIRKYKNKSYGERFKLTNFSSLMKNIFNITILISLFFSITFYFYYTYKLNKIINE